MTACNAPLYAAEGASEPISRPPEPSPSHPAEDGAVVCRACGFENVAGTSQCARPTCHKALPGNSLSNRTGLHALNTTPELREIEAAGRALFEQSLVDAGGRSELVARVVTQHEYRTVLDVNIRKVARALEVHGLYDRRGRLRVSWISKLESLITTALSIDRTLGTDRKARTVNFQERLAAAIDAKTKREDGQ